MRVLVTGGAGFIGASVVAELYRLGHEIRVLDALIAEEGAVREVPAFPDGVEFVRGDVRDTDTLESALRGIDVVSHQAAMVGRGREILDAPRYAGCNDLGTAVLVAAMTRLRMRRLVLASSVVIYGDCNYDCSTHGRVRPARRSREDLDAGRFDPRCPRCGAAVSAAPVDEDDLLDPPRNVYAITKLAQEYLTSAWARETGATVTALRYHNVYGPNMPYDSAYSGVASTFRSAVAKHTPANVFEDGEPRRDFIHVDDVARANVRALARAEAGFRAYNVATGNPHSILEMAEALTAAADGPAPEVTGDYRIGDVRHQYGSPARINAELGWHAEVPFEAGMKEFAAAPMRGLVTA